MKRSSREVKVKTRDGFELTAKHYSPLAWGAQALEKVVLINSATGVPQHYYAHYARFLAESGFDVLTYDYRGIGKSLNQRWAGKPLSMADWGRSDLSAMIDYLERQFPHFAHLAVGHSVGGQLIGLAPNNNKLNAVLTISSQEGYIGHWSGMEKFKFSIFTRLIIPGVTTITGDLPKAILGEPLPRGVARQWALWCRNPNYMVDRKGQPIRRHFESFTNHIRFYHITDDTMYAPLKAVEGLMRYYKHAQTDLQVRSPQDFGCQRVGHFGFFRKAMPRRAWQETAVWLDKPEFKNPSLAVA